MTRSCAWTRDRYVERVRVGGRWYHPGAPHGTASGYSNYGCRCRACTGEWTAATRRRRAERVARYLARDPVTGAWVTTAPGVVHGLPATYQNWACRCDACRRAATAARVARYRRARAGARAGGPR